MPGGSCKRRTQEGSHLDKLIGFRPVDLERRVGHLVASKAVLYAFPYLSDQARLVYLWLESLDYRDRGEIWYTQGRLAQLLRCSWHRIYWALRELAHYGLLAREQRPGGPNVWELCPFPEIELRRALFVRAYIDEGRSIQWPDNFDVAFRQYVERVEPRLIPALDRVDELRAEWVQIRTTRTARGRR